MMKREKKKKKKREATWQIILKISYFTPPHHNSYPRPSSLLIPLIWEFYIQSALTKIKILLVEFSKPI